jgi:hypothetical protein
MASQEELDREQELIRLTQQRAGIQEDILEDVRDIGNVISDQLKNLKFERQERTEIRSLVREVNKTASENYNTTLKDLGSQKQLAKIAKDRNNLATQLLSLQNLQQKFAQGTTKEEKDMAFALKEQITFTQNLINNLAQIESQSRAIANNFSVKTFDGLNKIVKDIPILRQFAAPFEAAANASRLVVAENSKLLSTGKGLTANKIEELGLTDKLLVGKNKDILLTGTGAAQKLKALGYDAESLGNQKALNAGAKELSGTFSKMASAAILGSIVNSFLQLNKAQVDFQRNIGASVNRLDTLNDSLISSVDYIQQANSLVEQFGFNVNVAFSSINTQEAAELTQLMGLAAEEANQLAYYSQANGDNLKDNAAQAYKNVSPLLSQRKVLQEISKVAPSIAMSFGGSAEELAKAASNARLLGLNLSQVDKIADGLLEIEQSLRSEFEAEVITGKQLNLERARFFALTNDIDGLTKEIANNQEVLNSFATGTRIEQQAIADSLGLSRDEISKMLFDQQILNKLSVEEAALKSGMSIEDAKRLTLQESINKSIAKFTEALALPMEFMASLVDNAGVLYGIMSAIGVITAVNFTKSLGSALVSMAAMIPKALTLLGIESGRAVAAITTASAMTLGLGAIGIIAAAAAAVAGFKALTSDAQNVQDGIAPSSKGPFTITDSFGATAVTAKGDSVVVSPNIQREVGINPILPQQPSPELKESTLNNNSITKNTTINNTSNRNSTQTTSVAIDYDKLAEAIAKGAELGTSKANINVNLDGNAIANNLQTPMAVNTRKYGI